MRRSELTPGASITERGLDVSSDGRKRADGDGEGEADRKSQRPDLKVKGQQVNDISCQTELNLDKQQTHKS